MFPQGTARYWGLLVLVVCGVCRGGDDLLPPEKYRLALELNLKSNLPNRRVERDAKDKIEGSPILHWEVPVEDIAQGSLHESPLIDEATRRFLFVEKREGDRVRRYVRIFARPEDTELIAAYKKYGEPKRQFLGVKLVSHATYFVWDPREPDRPPFSVKLLGGNSTNWAAEQTVKMSDVIERTMKDTPSKGVAFFPERFGVSHLGNTQVVRSWTPVGFTQEKNEMLLPAHGVLGSKAVLERLARLSGRKSAEEWIMSEYLPELGKAMAQLNYADGVYPELHTQNLTLNIDTKTGKVKGVVFQDITDAMVDPGIRLFQNRATHLENMKNQRSASVLHTRHIEGNTESILTNFVNYVSQSVLNWIDFQDMPAGSAELLGKLSAAAYLVPYLEKTAELTKVPVALGKAGQIAQKLLFGGKVTDAEVEEYFPGIGKVGPKERVAYLMGAMLHDAGGHQLTTLMGRHNADVVKLDQKLLREMFIKQARQSLFQAWNKEDGDTIARHGSVDGSKVEYLYLPGKGIVVIKENVPVALAHSLEHDDERKLHAAIPAGKRRGKHCGPDYQEI